MTASFIYIDVAFVPVTASFLYIDAACVSMTATFLYIDVAGYIAIEECCCHSNRGYIDIDE
jgi:hypothetical protein